MEIMESGDKINQNNPQTRNSPIGAIIFTNNINPSIKTFHLSIPIGIWFIGSIGYGVLDVSNCHGILEDHNKYLLKKEGPDASGRYMYYQDECYLKKPGIFHPSDVLNFHVINDTTVLNITYSGVKITPLSYSLESVFSDVSFSPYGLPNGHFYGVQYVGNIDISNLQLPVQALEAYDLDLKLSYTYNYDLAGEFDFFQTGLFFNLSSINQSSCQGITFNSKPPSPFLHSSFDMFTPGSTIINHTPYIFDKDILNTSNAFPTYIKLNNLNGNFQTLNIKRISNSNLSKNDTFYNIAGNSFIDRLLTPDSSFTYVITPVYNQMFGTPVTIGPIKTLALTIRGSVDVKGIATNSIPLINIYGEYSHYSIRRDISKNNVFVFDNSMNNLNKSSYTDVGLVAGATYQYKMIPYFTDTYNHTTQGVSYTIPGTYTTRNIRINTVYYAITPAYVKLKITDYVCDTVTIIRDGMPPRIFYDLSLTPINTQYLSQDPSNGLFFTDNDPKLLPGNSYTYSTIPRRNNIEGDRVFLTSPVKYRPTNVMNSSIKILIPTISITAKFGTITSNLVQIKDISGIFTSFSIQRNGYTNYNIDMSAENSQFIDSSQNGLISGHNYTYSLTPSFLDKLGTTFVLPNSVNVPL